LTVKRGKKRVYKSVKVLKAQCANKKKVKKKRKFKKRKFGVPTYGFNYNYILRDLTKDKTIKALRVGDDKLVTIIYDDGSNYHGKYKIKKINETFKIIKHGLGRLWESGVVYKGKWIDGKKEDVFEVTKDGTINTKIYKDDVEQNRGYM
jgi:hypothetical protein